MSPFASAQDGRQSAGPPHAGLMQPCQIHLPIYSLPRHRSQPCDFPITPHSNTHNGRQHVKNRSPRRSSGRVSRVTRCKGQKGYILDCYSMPSSPSLTLFAGLNFEEISKQIGKPEVWTAALFYGQAKVTTSPPPYRSSR